MITLTRENTRVTEMAFDRVPVTVLERHAAEQGIDLSESKEIFRELITFLSACAETPSVLVPSRTIDEAWHTFILFTDEYLHWCQETFGKTVHHRPLRAMDDKNASPPEYVETLHFLSAHYAIRPAYWASGAWSASPGCMDIKC